ncbi:MAG: hypothetical protein M3N98_06635 [Actinomycetota bacterium]|nr:hypothetical protein [Actinomycetota bacterium]
MILCFALYLAVAIVLDFRYLTFNGDAASRMANGFYVLYSRDPHLAAIGFVWNPGTSIADMVPLLFYHLWTPLASHMFAASLVSALSMAGAIYQVRCTLAEWGVPRLPRLVLVVLLALNAMIVYYGGNGMSEGLYLFTLLATCRYLLRWMRDDDLGSLVYAAIALGVCYIVRNEAVGPALIGGAAVLGVSFARRSSSLFLRTSIRRSARLWAALTDLVIFEIPLAAALVVWAVASFVITGSPFQQFTSVYGNTSQEKLLTHLNLHDRLVTDVRDVSYLAPTLLIALFIAVYLAVRRRDVGVLAPLAIVGGGLAFDVLGYAANTIQPFFRYFITAVPLVILLVGSFFATNPALLETVRKDGPVRRRARRWTAAALAAVVALVLIVPAEVTSVRGMGNPRVGTEETEFLGFIFRKHPTPTDLNAKRQYGATLVLADYLARQHFPDGQVVVDNFSPCIPQVITMSPNPDIFVIPNDRDYQRTLNDPLAFHTHYILDVDPAGVGGLTAPNTTFPTLWKTGAGFTTVVHTFPAAGLCAEFKLMRVTGHPNRATR